MAIRLRSGEGNQLLPEGMYDATLKKIEEASNAKGPFLKWHFAVSHEGKTQSVTSVSPMDLDRGSKTRYWVEAIIGRDLKDEEEIDLERLVGLSCRIVVYVATLDDGRQFNRIEKVLRRGGLTLSARKGPDPMPAEDLGGDDPTF